MHAVTPLMYPSPLVPATWEPCAVGPQILDTAGGMLGCEVFDDACFQTCEGVQWTNWYAAHRTTPV
jgi:hypothetical protein